MPALRVLILRVLLLMLMPFFSAFSLILLRRYRHAAFVFAFSPPPFAATLFLPSFSMPLMLRRFHLFSLMLMFIFAELMRFAPC